MCVPREHITMCKVNIFCIFALQVCACMCSRKRMIAFEVCACMFHVCTCVLYSHTRCSWTHFCVPVVYICVFHVVGEHICVRRCTHVFVLYKKRTLVFQLNTCMRVPHVNVYVRVHGCTSARAACTVSDVFICVVHMYTHMCVMCVIVCLNCPCDRALAQPHLTCVHARALARYRPQFRRGAEARSTPATHLQQRNACRVHDCIFLIHPC